MTTTLSAFSGPKSTTSRADRLVDELDSLLGVPFTGGNAVEVLRNGDQIFPSMLAAIAAARESIEMLTFVYWAGDIAVRFADALSERARDGVTVRVLLDAIGAKSIDRRLVQQMREAGVEVKWFRPLSWRLWRNAHRTHRKVLVCDRAVAFTGGVGIAGEWQGDAEREGDWRDTHFRVVGPAIAGLRAAFIGNWIEDGRTWNAERERPVCARQAGSARVQIIRTTSSHGWSDIATLQRSAISLAERSLEISAAYFVPDAETVALLAAAVRRGVDVRIITVGEQSDSRMAKMSGDDDIEELLDAGVRLFRFQPTMMHAKIILVDEAIAIVGSANFNQRSMRRDDEVCMVVADDPTLERLRSDFEHDLSRCEELTRETWKRRSLAQRFKEALGKLWHGHV